MSSIFFFFRGGIDDSHWSLLAGLVYRAYLAKFVFPALVLQIKTPFSPKAKLDPSLVRTPIVCQGSLCIVKQLPLFVLMQSGA